MSETSATMSNSQFVKTYQADLVENYTTMATLTLIGYEFVITFRYEYEFIWQRRWSGATWIFLANRCNSFSIQYLIRVLAALPMTITAAFSALRVFALLDRAYGAAALTFALGLVSVALDLYQQTRAVTYYVDDPVLGPSCYENYRTTPATYIHSKKSSDSMKIVLTYLLVEIINVSTAIAADLLAIVITWIKTHRRVRQASSAGIEPWFESPNPITIINIMLPNIMLSRFLINLRRIESSEPSSAARFSRFSPVNFLIPSISSVIGNLGEPLADGEEGVDDGEDIDIETYEDGSHAIFDSRVDERTADVLGAHTSGVEEVRAALNLPSSSLSNSLTQICGIDKALLPTQDDRSDESAGSLLSQILTATVVFMYSHSHYATVAEFESQIFLFRATENETECKTLSASRATLWRDIATRSTVSFLTTIEFSARQYVDRQGRIPLLCDSTRGGEQKAGTEAKEKKRRAATRENRQDGPRCALHAVVTNRPENLKRQTTPYTALHACTISHHLRSRWHMSRRDTRQTYFPLTATPTSGIRDDIARYPNLCAVSRPDLTRPAPVDAHLDAAGKLALQILLGSLVAQDAESEAPALAP
ncbi:hypothetical protein NM688_g4687 [Phlebia brevispora]|uniref:Uncharacterized protein n=1 Tax=Phlebia brevispora TaxID=194682 RepID=A0ACC1T2D9_9APHY|nr:hypothetical protein NM688_g4687 [Phlebia brevispora]